MVIKAKSTKDQNINLHGLSDALSNLTALLFIQTFKVSYRKTDLQVQIKF